MISIKNSLFLQKINKLPKNLQRSQNEGAIFLHLATSSFFDLSVFSMPKPFFSKYTGKN